MEKKVEDIFTRVGKAAQITGCSVSYIRQLIHKNKIKSYLPSPKVRLIEVESLISYIKNNKEVQ